MKLKYAVLPAAVAMLFSAASMAAPVQPDSGQITFKGSIKAPTCIVNNGVENFDYTIGDYNINDFQGVGTEEFNPSPLVIGLKNCTGTKAVMIMTAQKYNGDVLNIIEGEGYAEGVGVVLRYNDGLKKMKFDGTTPYEVKLNNGNGEFKFDVGYRKIADEIKPGTATAIASYFIRYN